MSEKKLRCLNHYRVPCHGQIRITKGGRRKLKHYQAHWMVDGKFITLAELLELAIQLDIERLNKEPFKEPLPPDDVTHVLISDAGREMLNVLIEMYKKRGIEFVSQPSIIEHVLNQELMRNEITDLSIPAGYTRSSFNGLLIRKDKRNPQPRR